MVWSIDLFNHYLRGRPFIVKSDCSALEWLKDKRPRGARINKWLLRLQEYDFKVVHRPGIKSANGDGLTRQPLPEDESYDVDPFETLPTTQVVVNVVTRAQRLKEATEILPPSISEEMLEEKHSDIPVFLPPIADEEPAEVEIFKNPFLPRRSNTQPFFDCEKDEEGWECPVLGSSPAKQQVRETTPRWHG